MRTEPMPERHHPGGVPDAVGQHPRPVSTGVAAAARYLATGARVCPKTAARPVRATTRRRQDRARAGHLPCTVCGEPSVGVVGTGNPVCRVHKRQIEHLDNAGYTDAQSLVKGTGGHSAGYRARVFARLEAKGLLSTEHERTPA